MLDNRQHFKQKGFASRRSFLKHAPGSKYRVYPPQSRGRIHSVLGYPSASSTYRGNENVFWRSEYSNNSLELHHGNPRPARRHVAPLEVHSSMAQAATLGAAVP
eukprot:2073900-Rhodomonas_salina.2